MWLLHSNINESQVKSYDNALRAIEMYISAGSYNKAIKACEEILEKEQQSLQDFLEKAEKNSGISKREISQFQEKQKTKEQHIQSLKKKATTLEEKYLLRIKEENFKILFRNTKKQIKNLVKLKKPTEAMMLLKELVRENKDKPLALSYYNTEKIKLEKEIQKLKKEASKSLKDNAHLEALSLIGKEVSEKNIQKKSEGSSLRKIKTFFKKFIYGKQYRFWDKIKQWIEEDRLIREYKELLSRGKVQNTVGVKAKLENMHKGLIKELQNNKVIGYDIYGKILWADKISGDTFWLEERKEDYIFYLGDATGHGVRAGLVISLLSKSFRKFVNKSFKELVFELNNELKQGLETRNFVTGVFCKIIKNSEEIEYVGMGHEPILLFHEDRKETEKKVLGGLAAGIRKFPSKDDVVVRKLQLKKNDILMIFSDGIVETRNENNEMYGIDRLQESFNYICKQQLDLQNKYNYIMDEVRIFKGSSAFEDDASILLLQRNTDKDLIEENDFDYLDTIQEKEWLTKRQVQSLIGKSKEEIDTKVQKIKKEKETKQVIATLKAIYGNGDILKLKQEAIRYIKEWYYHKDINNYLKKAIQQETTYKVAQKNHKMHNKYKVLEELFKKEDYDTVIREIENIIANDWEV